MIQVREVEAWEMEALICELGNRVVVSLCWEADIRFKYLFSMIVTGNFP